MTSFRVTQEGPEGVHMISIESFGGRSAVLAKTDDKESIAVLNGLRKVGLLN